jgi:hypothetical protein
MHWWNLWKVSFFYPQRRSRHSKRGRENHHQRQHYIVRWSNLHLFSPSNHPHLHKMRRSQRKKTKKRVLQVVVYTYVEFWSSINWFSFHIIEQITSSVFLHCVSKNFRSCLLEDMQFQISPLPVENQRYFRCRW